MEQARIPMKDGVRLAATFYMPNGGKPGEKFPALLEYSPYREGRRNGGGRLSPSTPILRGGVM
jgi:predicted acyl esterase